LLTNEVQVPATTMGLVEQDRVDETTVDGILLTLSNTLNLSDPGDKSAANLYDITYCLSH